MAFGISAGAYLMGGAVLGSALIGADAAGDAADAQAGAAAQSDATQRYQYDQTRKDTAPFRENGLAASNKLTEMLGLKGGDNPLMRNFSTADMNADPVYQSGLQFGLNEGTKGINRMSAAQGSMLSGATLKALTRFGNDYGSTKANESYNRFTNDQTNRYNRLAGLAGSGQTANAQIGAAGANMANNISASQMAAGNARASGYVGQANAINGAMGQGFNMYQNQQLMNKLFPQDTGRVASNFGGGGQMDDLKSYGVF